MNIEKKFGEILKEVRKSKKMTINALAENSGVDSGYLSRLENGKKDNPSAEIVNKLALVLGVSTDYLLGLSPIPSLIEVETIDLGNKIIHKRINLKDDLKKWEKIAEEKGLVFYDNQTKLNADQIREIMAIVEWNAEKRRDD